MPTSHNYTLSKDRLIILDCILNDEPINIGRIINKEIRDCAKKTEGYIFFACLITALCNKQRVDISLNERNQRKIPPAALSAKMKARRVSKAPEFSKKEEKEESEENKEEKQKENAVRRFMLDQHEWIKKRLEEISQAPTTLEIPEFPMWVFEDVATEKEGSEEGEVVEKKKKELKRKKETTRKGKGKKKKNEEEWIDVEETSEEEEEELKEMEKETEEEVTNTTTEGSEKNEGSEDFELGMTMEEYLRKKKGKSPVVEQIDPSQQTPTPMITTPPSTPPSTGSTPPPPKQADVIQKEKEPEKLPTKEPTPPIAQTKEKTPPIQEETPIVTPNITIDSSVLQVNDDIPIAQKETNAEGAKAATTSTGTIASASAQGASASEKAPTTTATVVEVVEGNIEETLNLVVVELAEKMREELGKKFLGTEAKAKEGGEAVKVAVSMKEPMETTTGEGPKEQEAEKGSSEEDSTVKDVAEVLKEMPEKVLEQTAELSKEIANQSGATAPGATAPESTPKSDKSAKTAALKTDATASKSGSKGGKKQAKPKPTPTRQSSRLRSGAQPQ